MTKKLIRGMLLATILLSISFTAAYASEVSGQLTAGSASNNNSSGSISGTVVGGSQGGGGGGGSGGGGGGGGNPFLLQGGGGTQTAPTTPANDQSVLSSSSGAGFTSPIGTVQSANNQRIGRVLGTESVTSESENLDSGEEVAILDTPVAHAEEVPLAAAAIGGTPLSTKLMWGLLVLLLLIIAGTVLYQRYKNQSR